MSFAADLIRAQDGDVVIIPLALARAIGLPAAAFLRQAAYLSAVVQKRDGWFYLEQEGPGDPNGEKIFQRLGSWQHSLGIGSRAQATIRQQLMSLGLLEETRKGTVHGKLHYRVNPIKYLNFLAECGRATDCIDEQTAESNCASCGEQVLKQQDAGCTTGTPQPDVYKVDVAGIRIWGNIADGYRFVRRKLADGPHNYRHETFQDAVDRLGLDEAQLIQQARAFNRRAFWWLAALMLATVWLAGAAWSDAPILHVVLCLGDMAFTFSKAITWRFRFCQIRDAELYSFGPWFWSLGGKW